MRNILEVENLTKDFTPPLSFAKLLKLDFTDRTPLRALNNISFSLKEGRILGILGPNGAGKTTLLKIIATLILPDKGKVTINGCRLGIDDDKIKSYIGMVYSEERSFYWRLTGRQNLEFFAALHNLKNTRDKIDKLLGLFKINYADKRFDSYSTGMKQKLSLIRGLLHEPQIILMDEPTRSLDYTTSLELRDFIKDILVKQQGKTVISTTHNMEEAAYFCDSFIILNKGELYGAGTLGELREKINNPAANIGEIFVKLCLKK